MRNCQSSSINLVSESEQEAVDHSTSTMIQAAIGSLMFMLLTTLQVMLQNQDKSPFQNHALIMKIFIVCAFIYTSVAVAVTILYRSHCTTYNVLPLLNHLGLILGAFACDFLLMILVPPFGYFVLLLCILMLLVITLKYYQQISTLIFDVAKLAFCRSRDLLRTMISWNAYAWIQQFFHLRLVQFLLPRSIVKGLGEGNSANDQELSSA